MLFPVVLAAHLAEKQHLTFVFSFGAHGVQRVTSSPSVRVLTVIAPNFHGPQMLHNAGIQTPPVETLLSSSVHLETSQVRQLHALISVHCSRHFGSDSAASISRMSNLATCCTRLAALPSLNPSPGARPAPLVVRLRRVALHHVRLLLFHNAWLTGPQHPCQAKVRDRVSWIMKFPYSRSTANMAKCCFSIFHMCSFL